MRGKVLLVGAGGLGSPAALYLAAAGVGTLGVADGDAVELSNLQRQVLHNTSKVGRPKVDSAKETLSALNGEIRVNAHRERIGPDNVLDLVAPYDLVVDGCDNFATRYLVSDACVHLKKPNAYGSIFRFEGQASLFVPGGPCYRCLFPEQPPAGVAPTCDEAGVLGVLPGIVGLLQATEAIKWLLGIGRSLAGRLLVYNALEQDFHEFKVAADLDCRACGGKAVPFETLRQEARRAPAGCAVARS
jgi:adenylyltransferase/sulfurtransferase